jgi:hypothetical protein
VIALVHRRPERVRPGIPREPDRIPQTGREDVVPVPSGLYSWMAARSRATPAFSGVALVAEPIVTYSLVPAVLKMTLRVQWLYPRVWLSGMLSRLPCPHRARRRSQAARRSSPAPLRLTSDRRRT